MLATRGMPREIKERGYIPRRGSIAEWVIENEEPLILDDDLSKETRFVSIARERHIRSSMCVPLKAKGKTIGTLNITRTESTTPFSSENLRTLQIMASQAAVAIENARLHKEVLQAARLATLGQTVSGISHCIKNILTGVKGGITVTEVAMETNDSQLQAKGWNMLKRNIERISLLVLDMLDYSKSRKPHRSLAELDTIISDVLATVETKAEEAKVKICLEVLLGSDPLCVDSDQIFRCLLNVVTNAIDASTPGSTITIRSMPLSLGETAYRLFHTDGVHPYTILEVVDEGCGIPRQLLDKIFDPFFSTKGSRGTGLGMPVTRKIIEEHGGRLEVDSTPGEGTTVRFLLPHLDEKESNHKESEQCTGT
jgi:signal transduction histidine kinase